MHKRSFSCVPRSHHNHSQPTFDFVLCRHNQSHIVKYNSIYNEFITCINRNSRHSFSDFFGLHGSLLVRYEDEILKKPMSFLDLNCASIQSINSNSLIINKNEGAFELKFLNEDRRENWLHSLRNFCVFSDFDDTYSKQQMIHEGSLAKVFVIQSRSSGRLFAGKAFDKYQFTPFALKNFKEALLKQIALVQTLDPRFIIRLHELYETEDSLYLIMDLIQGASLKEVLSTHIVDDELSEKQIKHIIYSIIECAQYMASNRVKHRDLKPENILIQPNGEIKIIDLGLSTYMNLPEYLFRTCGGSFGYMAPEAFDNHDTPTDGGYDHRCEVFSTGCILFEMLFGKPLFEGKNTKELIEANKNSEKLQTQISKIKAELKNKNSPINRKGTDPYPESLETNFHQ